MQTKRPREGGLPAALIKLKSGPAIAPADKGWALSPMTSTSTLRDNIVVLLTIERAYLFPALKRRDCGASQCVSNFGLKFAGRLNSIWRRIGGSGDLD